MFLIQILGTGPKKVKAIPRIATRWVIWGFFVPLNNLKVIVF